MKLLQIRRRDEFGSRGGRFGSVGTKLFCELPFTQINIMENGDVFPNCCPEWVAFPFGNLATQSWQEVWNGAAAQRFRASMLKGDLRYCDRHWCPHIQQVLRGDRDDIVVPFEQRPRGRGPRGEDWSSTTSPVGPSNVGLHYDDSCNLACPTCRAGIESVSGRRADEVARIHQIVETEILPGARSISLTGTGDPFASRFLRTFLTEFDRTRYPLLENIHLHTNAIMWTPSMWERMPGLHDLPISTDISIDAATPETYHVVRQPARWDRLIENLDFIVTIPNLHTLGVSMTVSQLNYREMVAFHDFGRALGERFAGRFAYVEYKRARRRPHHSTPAWAALELEQLPPDGLAELASQIHQIDALRRAAADPDTIRSNLDEFTELIGPRP